MGPSDGHRSREAVLAAAEAAGGAGATTRTRATRPRGSTRRSRGVVLVARVEGDQGAPADGTLVRLDAALLAPHERSLALAAVKDKRR